MKPTIKITVSGPQGSGKSLLIDAFWETIRRATGHPFEGVHIEFEEIQTPGIPAAVPVPLGANVTRGGNKARVICNDRKSGLPVVAFIGEDDESCIYYHADGRTVAHMDKEMGLVGHIPEPRKPKEAWIRFHKDSNPEVIVGLTPVADTPFTLFREVLP